MNRSKFIKPIPLADSKPHERKLLKHEITVIEQEIAKLAIIQSQHGDLLGEAMNQSSETSHDNAPAEVVRDDQEVLMRRAKPLLYILKHYVIVPYPALDDIDITIGSRVTLSLPDEDPPFKVDIVGFRPSNATTLDDAEILSYESPLAASLLGHHIGDTVGVDGSRTNFEVVEIDQGAIANRYS